MKNNLILLLMKNLLLFLVLSVSGLSFSQNFIMDGPASQQSFITCSGKFMDAGGDNGDPESMMNFYPNNMVDTITFCPDADGKKIRFNVEQFLFQTGDVLEVYDGDFASLSNIIGTFTKPSEMQPHNLLFGDTIQATFSNTTGCLTVIFRSNNDNKNDVGWIFNISCFLPCQEIVGVGTYNGVASGDSIIKICTNDVVDFLGFGIYPDMGTTNQLYQQSNNLSTFTWKIRGSEGSTIETGTYNPSTGFSEGSHTFADSGIYFITMEIQDTLTEFECKSKNYVHNIVYVSGPPTFSDPNNATSVLFPNLILGDTNYLIGIVDTIFHWANCEPSDQAIKLIPDGIDYAGLNSVDLDFEVRCYGNQTINDADDILSICLDIEHSAVGDLDMRLICPSGKSIRLIEPNIFNNANLGTPTFAGMGIPDYHCFTRYANETINEASTGLGTNTKVSTAPALPLDSISDLIGCPINGIWKIAIKDIRINDNGYAGNFRVNFSPTVQPISTGVFYASYVDSNWVEDPTNPSTGINITPLSKGDTLIVVPSASGIYNYKFQVINDFGCTYEKTLTFEVKKGVEGYVYHDFNQNCQMGATETKLSNFIVTIQPGNIIAETNENGKWQIDFLPVGNYTVTVDTSNLFWKYNCFFSESFEVTNADSITVAPNFAFVVANPYNSVEGYVYHDFNQNCQMGATETKLSNFKVTIQPGDIIAETNENGKWYIDSLPVGNYTITVDTTDTYWKYNCSFIQNFSIIESMNTIMAPNFSFVVANPFNSVEGNVYHDFDQNCLMGAGETKLADFRAIIQPGDIVVETNENGRWFIDSLPVGIYSITVDTSSLNWKYYCSYTQNFSVLESMNTIIAPNFGFIDANPCSSPKVTISMPVIRRGFNNQKIYISACNQSDATGLLENGYIEFTLDELITVNNSSLELIPLGNNSFRANVGNLTKGQCVNFNLNTTVSMTAVLGQTLCMEANLFPHQSCNADTIVTNPTFPNGVTPCTSPWDRSSLSVNGWCQNDSIYFTVRNTGETGNGDMDCFAPVRVYIDGQMYLFDSIRLLGQETRIFAYAGTGQTWRLEADQHPLHPGNSHPNATVELCGNAENWTPGMVTVLPQDDAAPVKDIFCGQVTGSYDPNDKQGFPNGISDNHFIMPNQDIEYLIRFQNTGSDTAFTVIIRDTLDMDLDIFSVSSGVSSHNYTFTMHGPRVLEWTFNNILLPDSTTNQEASNGFVTFRVKQNLSLENGTQITNSADIYFDFNEPIITNKTLHTVNSCIQNSSLSSISVFHCGVYFAPDGQTYSESGNYRAIIPNHLACDSIISIQLTILETSTSLEEITNCESYTWNGNTYSTSGVYETLLTNAQGCDSIATLDLTILNPTSGTETITACENYSWNGNTYISNGIYEQILTNAQGCDSIVTLNLTIKAPTSSSITENVCESYTTPDGQVYTISGTYTAIIPNTAGCDSTININLTIQTLDLSVSNVSPTLIANESMATYQWLDCNNNFSEILGANQQEFTPETNGLYAVRITKENCEEVSDCYLVDNLKVSQNDFGNKLSISPNPTQGILNVSLGKTHEKVTVKVYDVSGKLLLTEIKSNSENFEVTINGVAGYYLFNIESSSGEKANVKVVKE
jgi:uncharacterized repeat protein (TIGR01451 family)